MTNQPTNNEWIEKAQDEFIALVMSGIDTEESFRTAIIDNLPQSISREAVEKLRRRYRKIAKGWGATPNIAEQFVYELDALLCNQNDD